MKNLKKGLAVAMSLAMVATVLPTNVMANDGSNVVVGTVTGETTDIDKAMLIMEKVETIFTEDVIASINKNTTIAKIDPDASLLDGASTGKPGTTMTVVDYLSAAATAGAIQETLASIADAGKYGAFAGTVGKEVYEKVNELANTLLDLAAGIDDLETVFSVANTITADSVAIVLDGTDHYIKTVGGENVYIDANGTFDNDMGTNAPAVIKDLNKALMGLTGEDYTKGQLGNYKTNLIDATVEKYDDAVAKIQAALEDLEAVYPNEVATEFAKDAYTAADAKIADVVKTAATGELEDISNYAIVSTSKKNAEAAIAAVEKLAGYDTYANDDKVLELMEALEAIIEKAEIVIDINNKKTNDSLKAYTSKLSSTDYKVANEIMGLRAVADGPITTPYATSKTYKDFFEAINANNADKTIANMTSSLLNVFLDYQEDYSDVFFTATVKEAGKRYVPDITKEDVFGNNETYEDNLTPSTSPIYGAYKNTDKEYTGKSIIEEIIAHIEGKDAAVKAVTTGLKGVTVNNLSSANAAKVVAAEKALAELAGSTGLFGDDEGIYTKNLSSAEKKSVTAAYKNAKMLIEKMYASGIVAGTAGWVDLGNGNWDFFNEDGTPATKWVAAGKLWYYVKGGHMLTNSWVAQDATGKVWYYVNGKGEMVVNTTIDGYAINANGEWHKK